MSGAEDLYALIAGDTVPQVAADIPVRALEAIGDRLAQVGQERAGVMDSQYQYGWTEGRHDLVRELAEIIRREMAPAVELERKLKEVLGEAGG